MRRTDLAPIRRAKLFSGLPERRLVAMLAPSFVQSLPAGTVLCRQGEKPAFLHIVISGRVGLFGEWAGDEALVEVFGPGDALIVPAVALDLPALLTARMLEEGRILMWPAPSFRDQVRSNAALAYGAMYQLCGHWRLLVGQLKDLKLLSATERLATLLLSLAPRGVGAARVMLPGSRRLVAGMLGVAPQSLSRAFAGLRPIGISGGGREITIVDVGRLRELAGARDLKDTRSRPIGRKAA
jgi:CRP/FNR family transcriptional activator FtrB